MNTRLHVGILVAVAAAMIGCTPADMGSVSGKVTLDGKPLEKALIRFEPVTGERASMGETDADGNYTLLFSLKKKGAKVGEHKVTITTAAEPYPDPDSGEFLPARPELLPKKYNVETTLTATVKGGSNDIPFELDSDGEIFEQKYEGQDN